MSRATTLTLNLDLVARQNSLGLLLVDFLSDLSEKGFTFLQDLTRNE